MAADQSSIFALLKPLGTRFRVECATRFKDIDGFGHINNASYLGYLEEARLAFRREIMQYHLDDPAITFPVAHLSIDYISSGKYPSSLTI